jgi:phenylacetaldehyde dehydrogenase
MAGWATRLNGETIPVSSPGNWHAYTLREPVGVVGQIIPWNFPLMMAAWKLAPALAAGCTIVLKPAEQTPLSALRFSELIQEAGVPDGVVNIVTGFGETAGAALAAHMDVDKIAFTGSTEVGKLIVNASTGNLKRVSLELGGKSPAIVFSDADLDLAVAGTASAIFYNQGQCCTAGSRLFAHKSVYDRVINGVVAEAGKLKIGHGLDPTVNLGPLVSREQHEKVTGFIRSGRSEGAEVVTGGKTGNGHGYFVEPTVLAKTGRVRCVDPARFGRRNGPAKLRNVNIRWRDCRMLLVHAYVRVGNGRGPPMLPTAMTIRAAASVASSPAGIHCLTTVCFHWPTPPF